MSDFFGTETYSDNVSTAGVTSGSRFGTGLDTGDLRRKFNFGDRVSELALAQDPFFRFVSKVSKKATDDPSFKFTEKRGSWHKRYAYVCGLQATAMSAVVDEATVADGVVAQGQKVYVLMGADYLSAGNKTLVYGQTNTSIEVGNTGTQPTFFVPGQLVKIPYGNASATFSNGLISGIAGYLVLKVETVDTDSVANYARLYGTIVKGFSGAAIELAAYQGATNAIDDVDLSGMNIHDQLEPKRSYVVGTAFGEGTGYPETWKDQPYSTGQGQTQIWKTSMAMTNTARATSLKYESNEWARIWREKLIEHKFDIEQSLLFGQQYTGSDGVNYTQGAVDWITTYGNSFTWSVNDSQDDFLDDMSNYMDPRYNSGGATVFFCRTDVYNWLHKLDGYFANNLEKSANYRYDFAVNGKSKTLGIDITKISTVYGDMNVARNIHLDGTNVAMLGVDMKHCAYRPLVGNGLNRDTSVYVGVQTLENSGVDRRVDMILTEAGMQWEMPEAHAAWIDA